MDISGVDGWYGRIWSVRRSGVIALSNGLEKKTEFPVVRDNQYPSDSFWRAASKNRMSSILIAFYLKQVCRSDF